GHRVDPQPLRAGGSDGADRSRPGPDPGMQASALLGLIAALQEAEEPKGFEARGKLVCLIEEMKDKYKSEANPIHDHILGYRVEGAVPAGGARYYTILRNKY